MHHTPFSTSGHSEDENEHSPRIPLNAAFRRAIASKDPTQIDIFLKTIPEDEISVLLKQHDWSMKLTPLVFNFLRYPRDMIKPMSLTPLQYAAVMDDTEQGDIVGSLITACADVEGKGSLGCTPLHLASRFGHHGAVSELMNAGASADAHDARNHTPKDVARGVGILQLLHHEPEYVQVESPSPSRMRTGDAPQFPVGNAIKVDPCKVTWAQFAGRPEGHASYEFGDALHGVWNFASALVTGKKMKYKANFPKSAAAPTPVGSDMEDLDSFDMVPEDEVCFLEEVGTGASSTVYKALWNGKLIAAKVLKVDFMHKSRRLMFKEIGVLSQLKHQNIVHFVGAYGTHNLVCMYCEFAEQGSLHNTIHIKKVEYSPGTMARWAKEISSALAFVHNKNIIHRDIKSPNVLMFRRQPNGAPEPPAPYQPVPSDFHPAPPHLLMCKLCDFGIATMSDSGFASSNVEPTLGTVAWMAPEVMQHHPLLFSSKIDTYSFGMVLYELITHRLPFEGLEWQQIMMGVASENMRPQIPLNIELILIVLVTDCWQSDPKKRPTMPEVIKRLAWLADKPEFQTE
eukprot:m.128133 g.128133  ORF g.128133 m.128133 type:complete len:570 (+) comp17419_c0_seq1:286-1995(+)